MSESHKGIVFTDEHKANMSKNHARPMLGKNHSKKSIEQMKKTRKERYVKEEHSLYGKIWINNDVENRLIKKDAEIPFGFKRGQIKRNFKNKKDD
jgi:hypothetical protein